MNDFGLYWWQPPKGWTNIGDEISPIVLGHVTGRHIVHASLDTCDGIAIGSVFLPRKAARRKRATPLFIWGSGTLQPQPTDYTDLSVIIAALRGPHTRGQIANCPDVPFGDPGLFARELWPGADRVAGRIGIVPHHSMLRNARTRALLAGLGDTKLLDMTSPDIAGTMRQLSECSLIVTSSLHGLIFADAYGIPSLFWNEQGTENEWKYREYFDGVGRPDFVGLPAAEILALVQNGGTDGMPVSVLAEADCVQTLSDLRAAAALIPGGTA